MNASCNFSSPKAKPMALPARGTAGGEIFFNFATAHEHTLGVEGSLWPTQIAQDTNYMSFPLSPSLSPPPSGGWGGEREGKRGKGRFKL